jgi:hypothetical protein
MSAFQLLKFILTELSFLRDELSLLQKVIKPSVTLNRTKDS